MQTASGDFAVSMTVRPHMKSNNLAMRKMLSVAKLSAGQRVSQQQAVRTKSTAEKKNLGPAYECRQASSSTTKKPKAEILTQGWQDGQSRVCIMYKVRLELTNKMIITDRRRYWSKHDEDYNAPLYARRPRSMIVDRPRTLALEWDHIVFMNTMR